MTTLRTSRLTLRPPGPADAAAVLAIHRDPRTCAHNPSDALATHADAAELCGRWLAHWERHGFGYWVVRRHGEPEVAGFCGVKAMTLADRPVLNLFYRFDPAFWGGGLASEAATEVVRWAAVHRPEMPVVARVRPANSASHRVAVRAGLVRAAHLDEPGFDGVDELYTAGWVSPPVPPLP
jgi:RimJ/RimL family protein N-acetyltransferase